MSKCALTLYTRHGCHLCEDMQQQIQAELKGHSISLRLVEVSGDPELESQYGTRVPVLASEQGEICHYFLDLVALQQYMRQC